MMKIKIIAVGRLKEKYLIDASREYEKRLQKYINLEIIELKDEKDESGIFIEGERILQRIPEDSFVFGLFIEGEPLSSTELSKKISELSISGEKCICFIIGGSYGLSSDVKKRCNSLISFSKMTFPHQLIRIFLLEQIYRSYKIIKNEPYHK